MCTRAPSFSPGLGLFRRIFQSCERESPFCFAGGSDARVDCPCQSRFASGRYGVKAASGAPFFGCYERVFPTTLEQFGSFQSSKRLV